MKIAILLTVHNRKDTTLRCLEQLQNQSNSTYLIDIFLTNDGCTDGTPEAIHKTYPHIHIINGNGKLFWNRGMYLAWKTASKKSYDYYIWLNDDTILLPNAIDNLITSSKEKNNSSIIVGCICADDLKTITYGGRIKKRLHSPSSTLKEVETFNGNLVLIPRNVYEKIGFNDPFFSHSFGDFEYGLRAQKHGIKSYQTNMFLGICNRHAELPKWCNKKYKLKERIKHLYSPTGYPPKEVFYFESKYYNIFIAIFHCITLHIRCLFPFFWDIINKSSI